MISLKITRAGFGPPLFSLRDICPYSRNVMRSCQFSAPQAGFFFLPAAPKQFVSLKHIYPCTLYIYTLDYTDILQVFKVFFSFLFHRLQFHMVCTHESFPFCAKLQLKIKRFYSIRFPRSDAVLLEKPFFQSNNCKNIIQFFQPEHTKRPLPKEGPPVVCYAFQTGSLTWCSCSGSGSGR